ncbi:MAG: HAD hydrolase-like protein [Bacteroidales bacterium]
MSLNAVHQISKINTILWDWNGTLLNDVEICLNAINELLDKRRHSVLSLSTYKDIFTFPVKEYYIKAGFDFSREPFDKVAIEFINLYAEHVKNAAVFPEVTGILHRFKKAGFSQYIVSAMEHTFLKETIENKGILNLLDGFSGITDHYAGSKLEMAKRFLQIQDIDPETSCLIGDTMHDFEVSESLGLPCLLVASGHQSENRLRKTGAPVFQSLGDVATFFQINHSEIDSI